MRKHIQKCVFKTGKTDPRKVIKEAKSAAMGTLSPVVRDIFSSIQVNTAHVNLNQLYHTFIGLNFQWSIFS